MDGEQSSEAAPQTHEHVELRLVWKQDAAPRWGANAAIMVALGRVSPTMAGGNPIERSPRWP